MNVILVLAIFSFVLALYALFLSGKGDSLAKAVVGFVLTVIGGVCIWVWVLSLGIIPDEYFFNRKDGKKDVYVFVGDVISVRGGVTTHITTLFVPGDREYTYRFSTLPPKGYSSMKTEEGKVIFIREGYALPK